MAHTDVVLQNQDCFGTTGKFLAARFPVGGFGRRRDSWKIDPNQRSGSLFTFNSYLAAALANDSVAGGQSQAGGAILGGKERFKQVSLHFLTHAGAGVLEADHDVLPWDGFAAYERGFIVVGKIDNRGPDSELAT